MEKIREVRFNLSFHKLQSFLIPLLERRSIFDAWKHSSCNLILSWTHLFYIGRDFGFVFLCIIVRLSWQDCPTLSKHLPWFSLSNSLVFTSKFPGFHFRIPWFSVLSPFSMFALFVGMIFLHYIACTDVNLVMSRNPTILNTLYVELNAIKQTNAMRGEVTSEFIRDSIRNQALVTDSFQLIILSLHLILTSISTFFHHHLMTAISFLFFPISSLFPFSPHPKIQ